MANQMVAAQNVALMKSVLSKDAMKKKFKDILGENGGAFIASLSEVYSNDQYLQECDPNKVILEAVKAASLKLPITKALGLAYIVAYKGNPQFQLGYKGLIQLAQRSGQYRYINAEVVYEGMEVKRDWLTGMVEITGEPTSDKAIGYIAYFELLNGFRKALYWTREKVEAHAKRFSMSYGRAGTPWSTNFDAMAIKTVLKNLLSKYGVMSVEFATALAGDITEEEPSAMPAQANAVAIEIPAEELREAPAAEDPDDDPGF